jgi:hypothetical protein
MGGANATRQDVASRRLEVAPGAGRERWYQLQPSRARSP